MSEGMISFMFALGSGAWIYNKFMKRTGGLQQRALTVAVAAGIVLFFGMFILLSVFLPESN